VTHQAQKETLHLLESSLVREFRTAQALLRLVREEQAALSRGDALARENAPRLLVLAEHKESLLDRLSGLEAARRVLLTQMAVLCGAPPDSEAPLPEAVRSRIEVETAARLDRLLEGIQVLSAEVRSLAHANRLLAAVALKRSADLQAGLLTSTPPDSLPALCAAILDARNALDANEPVPSETNLLETIAGLYKQDKAYQAVMRVSSRMIAGV
jgi:flagellar biosynthesis/type III secretory pathway chaperone